MNAPTKKTAALHNLGCKVNAYETEAMQQLLEEDGYEIVDFSEKADVYVINTCSVTNIADRKSRQMLHRAKKNNPNGIVVAAGCYVQTKAKEAKLDKAVDLILGNNRKQDLITAIEAYKKDHGKNGSMTEISHRQPYENLSLTHTAGRTRAFIKVQDGCNQFCSYCIIPYARGRVRSRSFEEAVSEAKTLSQNGYQEVVLTGIHLSSYGADIGETLLHLIWEISKIKGIKRIRLGSLEPEIVTGPFAKALSQIEKICPHFHLSLQSGCNATLKRMNRAYTTEEFYKSCGYLRKYFSHPAVTTDIIVGFPQETQAEFDETKAFLEKVRFYEMHIFKYSRREGTKAAVMPNQIPEETKAKRSETLISLANEMSEEFRSYYIGKEVEALMEEPVTLGGRTYFSGYTKEYVKVLCRTEQDLTNRFVKGSLIRNADGMYLMG